MGEQCPFSRGGFALKTARAHGVPVGSQSLILENLHIGRQVRKNEPTPWVSARGGPCVLRSDAGNRGGHVASSRASSRAILMSCSIRRQASLWPWVAVARLRFATSSSRSALRQPLSRSRSSHSHQYMLVKSGSP